MTAVPVVSADVAAYEPPAIAWEREEGEVERWLWWVVLVGYAYTLALAFAAYCRHKGGHPDISFSWKGFKVACHR